MIEDPSRECRASVAWANVACDRVLAGQRAWVMHVVEGP